MATIDPAIYILFDELFKHKDSFISLNKQMHIRLLGRLFSFNGDTEYIRLTSPFQSDPISYVDVDVQFFTDDKKRSLFSESACERLVQFIGELNNFNISQGFKLIAFTFSFMDGVNLDMYRSVVQITRSYVKETLLPLGIC